MRRRKFVLRFLFVVALICLTGAGLLTLLGHHFQAEALGLGLYLILWLVIFYKLKADV